MKVTARTRQENDAFEGRDHAILNMDMFSAPQTMDHRRDRFSKRNIYEEEDEDEKNDEEESDVSPMISKRRRGKDAAPYDVMIIVQRSASSGPTRTREVDDGMKSDSIIMSSEIKGLRQRQEQAHRRLAAAAGDSVAIVRTKLEVAGFIVSEPHSLNQLDADERRGEHGESDRSSSRGFCLDSILGSLETCAQNATDEEFCGCCSACLGYTTRRLKRVMGSADDLILIRAHAPDRIISRHLQEGNAKSGKISVEDDGAEESEMRDRPPEMQQLSPAQRQMVISRILATSVAEGGAEIRPNDDDVYVQRIVPLHDVRVISILSKEWVWQRHISVKSNAGGNHRYSSSIELADMSSTSSSSSTTLAHDDDDEDDVDAGRFSSCGRNGSFARCCRLSWRKTRTAFDQPLHRVASYFGEHVAFYFAYLGFYTCSLSVPAVAGLVLFVAQWWTGTPRLDHPFVPAYCAIIALWAELQPILWKRSEVGLAHEWGVLHFAAQERTRPQYKGTWRRDPLTGERERVYPRWKRWIRQLVSATFISFCLLAVLFGLFYAFDTHERLISRNDGNVPDDDVSKNGTNTTSTAERDSDRVLSESKIFGTISDALDDGVALDFGMRAALYGMMIPIMSAIFESIARRLNDFENHRTETSHHDHLTSKVFSIRFLINFSPLFYYAFMTRNVVEEPFEIIGLQLAGTFFTVVVLKRAFQVLWLKAQMQWKEEKLNRSRRRVRLFPGGRLTSVGHDRLEWLKDDIGEQAWKQATMLGDYSHFEDFADIMIQYGYVTFFSVAFPLVPLLCLIANVVKIRADAYRLCNLTRRPVPRRASGIGVWLEVQRAMARISLLTNCLHIAMSSDQVSNWLPHGTSQAQKVAVYVGIEHILIVVVWLLYLIIPTVPYSIRRVLKRERRLSHMQHRRHFRLGKYHG